LLARAQQVAHFLGLRVRYEARPPVPMRGETTVSGNLEYK
jgi:hypothetical protein